MGVDHTTREPILAEREKTHGSFTNVANTAQAIKGEMATEDSKVNNAQLEALHLIATKIARIVHGNPNEPDHWRDIAGYAKLGEEACDG